MHALIDPTHSDQTVKAGKKLMEIRADMAITKTQTQMNWTTAVH